MQTNDKQRASYEKKYREQDKFVFRFNSMLLEARNNIVKTVAVDKDTSSEGVHKALSPLDDSLATLDSIPASFPDARLLRAILVPIVFRLVETAKDYQNEKIGMEGLDRAFDDARIYSIMLYGK